MRDILAEPLRIWGAAPASEQEAKVRETLDAVGLDPDVALDKRPHQFSGGQCQRISIARALVMEPDLIICDEPVSALDVSVQAQILNLLDDLKARYDLTLVFIAHDLAVVKHVSTRVAVMYLGKICEVGDPDALYARPAHPYTAALLASIPVPDPDVRPDDADLLTGDLPSPVDPPSGCRFRVPPAQAQCAAEEPTIRQVGPDQFVACHFPLRDARAGRAGDVRAIRRGPAPGSQYEIQRARHRFPPEPPPHPPKTEPYCLAPGPHRARKRFRNEAGEAIGSPPGPLTIPRRRHSTTLASTAARQTSSGNSSGRGMGSPYGTPASSSGKDLFLPPRRGGERRSGASSAARRRLDLGRRAATVQEQPSSWGPPSMRALGPVPLAGTSP